VSGSGRAGWCAPASWSARRCRLVRHCGKPCLVWPRPRRCLTRCAAARRPWSHRGSGRRSRGGRRAPQCARAWEATGPAWVAGFAVSRGLAEAQLAERPRGAFLVRLCSEPGAFAVSCHVGGAPGPGGAGGGGAGAPGGGGGRAAPPPRAPGRPARRRRAATWTTCWWTRWTCRRAWAREGSGLARGAACRAPTRSACATRLTPRRGPAGAAAGGVGARARGRHAPAGRARRPPAAQGAAAGPGSLRNSPLCSRLLGPADGRSSGACLWRRRGGRLRACPRDAMRWLAERAWPLGSAAGAGRGRLALPRRAGTSWLACTLSNRLVYSLQGLPACRGRQSPLF